jgi:anti-sigma regulatory factor (Ser/Thr protein kinase)
MAGGKTVELLLPALPEHVRTARLVVVAVARRAGLADALVDELRLAVGEACARAVSINAQHAPDSRIALSASDGVTGLVVTVTDAGTSTAQAGDLDEGSFAEGTSPEVALALLQGLVDEVEVSAAPGGGTEVRMTWPLPVRATG